MGDYGAFDDVAFYFLVCSLLGVFLIPATIVVVLSHMCSTATAAKSTAMQELEDTSLYSGEAKKIVVSKSFRQKYLKPINILIVLGWLLFLFLYFQLPADTGEDVDLFNPWKILDVAESATDGELKKAYRKLSLKWHPDKNLDNLEVAEQEFILVAKAYQTLTDPVAKDNWEKYGTADGPQGSSYSIGLPSYLTRPENHLHILLVYFLLMIVIPPVCVFVWWRKASEYHESGVLHITLQYYLLFITEHMGPRHLIEILAISHEFRQLDDGLQHEEKLKGLFTQIKGTFESQRIEAMIPMRKKLRYGHKAHILIHAYLLRLPIPEEFTKDMTLILQHSHRLLSAMLKVCHSKRFVRPLTGCVDLMQSITQALWSQEPLLQLPHMQLKDLGGMKKKSIFSINKFRETPVEKRKKLAKNVEEAHWPDIQKAVDQFPDLDVTAKSEVEGEEGIFEGDFVTISVTLTRLQPGERQKREQEEERAVVEAKEEEEEEEEEWEVAERERILLDSVPVAPKRHVIGKQGEAPWVLAPLFPFERRERWFVFLFFRDGKAKQRLVSFMQLDKLAKEETVQFIKFPVAKSGSYSFEVLAKTDAYVGCDIKIDFKVVVEKMSQEAEEKRQLKIHGSLDVDEDEDDFDDEEPPAIWYYLYYSSFPELVLNLIAWGVVLFFAHNFLHSRGYWQKYFEPVIDRIMVYVGPVVDRVWPYVSPVLSPLGALFMRFWNWFTDIIVVPSDDLHNSHEDL